MSDPAAPGTGRSRRTHLVVVTAGLSQPSATRLLAERLAEATVAELESRDLGVEVEILEVAALAHDLTTRLVNGLSSPELDAALDRVSRADGLIAVTPVFAASFSGLFKSFFDVLDPEALAGMPVLIAATGGSDRHSLVLEHALRPLFAYLKAVVTPTGVYAATADWGAVSSGAVSGADGLTRRVRRAAAELASLVERAAPRTVTDPFALPAGFDPASLGRRPAGSLTRPHVRSTT